MKAIITNIQGYSIHDGPGIRTVAFFKGCTLACQWCSNPENLVSKIQMGFISRLCTGCGRCFAACGAGAIRSGEKEYRIDCAKCTSCGDCIAACYYGALVRYGEEYTVSELFAKLRADKIFYDESGGGVTLSGGEAMIHADFAAELFAMLHEDGITAAIETCGFVPWASFEKVLPVTDLFLYDLKHMDSSAHRKYTGQDNELILENARKLSEAGADILFRLPLVPGVNTSQENTEDAAEFLLGLPAGYAKLQLMPYHRMGQSKYEALGLKCHTEDVGIMSNDEVNEIAKAYCAMGVDCTVSR